MNLLIIDWLRYKSLLKKSGRIYSSMFVFNKKIFSKKFSQNVLKLKVWELSTSKIDIWHLNCTPVALEFLWMPGEFWMSTLNETLKNRKALVRDIKWKKSTLLCKPGVRCAYWQRFVQGALKTQYLPNLIDYFTGPILMIEKLPVSDWRLDGAAASKMDIRARNYLVLHDRQHVH